jgi:hypothetical protein
VHRAGVIESVNEPLASLLGVLRRRRCMIAHGVRPVRRRGIARAHAGRLFAGRTAVRPDDCEMLLKAANGSAIPVS